MDRIKKTSKYMSLFSGALLMALPLLSLIVWSFTELNTTGSGVTFGFVVRYFLESIQKDICTTPETYATLTSIHWTPTLRLFGFCANMIGMLPVLLGLCVLRAMFKNYQKGEIFTLKNAILYRRLGFLCLLDGALTSWLSDTLLGLALTLTNTPGQGYLSVSFGTQNIPPIFYGAIVILVSWVMIEASKLQDDQKFTI
jgi:hypothetical protein